MTQKNQFAKTKNFIPTHGSSFAPNSVSVKPGAGQINKFQPFEPMVVFEVEHLPDGNISIRPPLLA